MANVIKLTCEAPDEILNAGAYGAAALIRLQTSATEAGAYADVTGTGSTPTTVVTTGIRIYTAYDPNGTSSSWYQSRFENTGATRLSDWTAPFQVGGEASGLICSLYDVKQALGLGTGTANDEDLLSHIRQVTAAIQSYTGRQFCRIPSSGTTTYTFDVARYGRTLWVSKGIATCTQVEVATATGGAFTIVSAADWYLDPPVQDRSFGWPATRITIASGSASAFNAGKRVVRLTMALGWDTVPDDVEAIGQRAAVASFLSKDSAAGGTVVSGPTGATLILRHISPADRASLDSYRHTTV